jgi:hypothetical protein
MKNIVFYLLISIFVASCAAGEFGEKRNRLHNMGQEDICIRHPERCITIEGKQIPW